MVPIWHNLHWCYCMTIVSAYQKMCDVDALAQVCLCRTRWSGGAVVWRRSGSVPFGQSPLPYTSGMCCHTGRCVMNSLHNLLTFHSLLDSRGKLWQSIWGWRRSLYVVMNIEFCRTYFMHGLLQDVAASSCVSLKPVMKSDLNIWALV